MDDLDDEFADLEDAKEGSSADDVEDFANISRSGFGDDGFGSSGSQFGSPPPSQPKSDFDFIPSHQATQSQGSFAAPKADAHDWDAIFAGLDEGGSQAQTGTGQSPFESLETPRPGSSSNPQGQEQQQKEGEEQKKEGAGGGLGGQQQERPAPGRALTTSGEHDDPIVKNLTSMGYSRDQVVKALEKYDYNLDRVSSVKS